MDTLEFNFKIMKKNTNVDKDTDYNFDDDSFTNDNIELLDEEELEGALEYYNELIKLKGD